MRCEGWWFFVSSYPCSDVGVCFCSWLFVVVFCALLASSMAAFFLHAWWYACDSLVCLPSVGCELRPFSDGVLVGCGVVLDWSLVSFACALCGLRVCVSVSVRDLPPDDLVAVCVCSCWVVGASFFSVFAGSLLVSLSARLCAWFGCLRLGVGVFCWAVLLVVGAMLRSLLVFLLCGGLSRLVCVFGCVASRGRRGTSRRRRRDRYLAWFLRLLLCVRCLVRLWSVSRLGVCLCRFVSR